MKLTKCGLILAAVGVALFYGGNALAQAQSNQNQSNQNQSNQNQSNQNQSNQASSGVNVTKSPVNKDKEETREELAKRQAQKLEEIRKANEKRGKQGGEAEEG